MKSVIDAFHFVRSLVLPIAEDRLIRRARYGGVRLNQLSPWGDVMLMLLLESSLDRWAARDMGNGGRAAARGDRVEICVSTIFSRGAFLEPAERLLESKCKIQRRGGLGMLHRKVRITGD